VDPFTNIISQADGKVLAYVNGNGFWLRLNPDGTLDSGFARVPGGNGFPVGQLFVDGDGRVLLPGSVPDPATGYGDLAVTRYTPDGSGPDLTFGSDGAGDAVAAVAPGGDSSALSLTVQSDGKIVAVGWVSTDNDQTYHMVLARFQGDDQLTVPSNPATVQRQLANTVSFLQDSSTDTTLPPVVLAADPTTVDSVLAAVNALPEPSSGTTPRQVEVDVNLTNDSYSDLSASPPLGVTLVINGNGGSTTIVGHSPALAVASGNVIVENVTLTTATDAPTILVTGGSLTLRNDTIQESTGSSDAAIAVTGGTVDMGTASSPGGNTINVNGAGAFASNTTSSPIPAVGDTFTVNGAPLTPSSLSGVVWEDFNDDGQVDFGEKGISGVTITLTGSDFLGNPVSLSQQTDSDGAYVFLNLYPGTYTLAETQPAGYLQGIDSVGTAGGSLSATDQFSVALGVGVNGLNYNYGEQPPAGGSVQHGQTAGIGFWNNKNGQALIKALPVVTNADGSVTSVANWLAATLPNIFGKNSANDLAGQSNAYVAALFQQDFVLKGVKLDAQVLATALSVYATNATLDSTQVAAQYGFTVSGDGAGTATVNVGSNGAAFGVANNTTLTLLDLLLATDEQAVNGVLYNGDALRRSEANSVYSAVNQAGGS
jgi:hypothetical protein